MKNNQAYKKDENPLVSERFRLGTGAFFTRIIYLYGTVPLSIIGFLLLVAIVLAFVLDARFAIVSLMIIFLFSPAAFAWLYVSRGMDEGSSFNIAWHTIEITPRGITVSLYKPVYRENDPQDLENNSDKSGMQEEVFNKQDETDKQDGLKKEETIVGWERGKEIVYKPEDLGRFITGGDGITIPLKGGRGFIAVTKAAFPIEEDYDKFVELFGILLKNIYDTER